MPQGYGFNTAKAAAARVMARRPASVVATTPVPGAIPKIPSVSLSFDYPEPAINVRQFGMLNQYGGSKTTNNKNAVPRSVTPPLPHFNNVIPSAYRSAPSSPAAAAARTMTPTRDQDGNIQHSQSFNKASASKHPSPAGDGGLAIKADGGGGGVTAWTVGGALKSTKPVPPRFLPADRQSNLKNIKERYTFKRELGRGKFGVVYEAVDLQTEEKVAVKVLDKLQCGPAQCNHELKMMEQIKSQVGHDRFTPIKGVFEDADNIYFVIELLKGGELFDVIQTNGHISEEEAAVVVRKLAFALEALHRHGILHRDIKLENLVLTKGAEYERTPYASAMQDKFNNDGKLISGSAGARDIDNESVSSEIDEPNEFKITDFGFSQEVGTADAFDTPAGTLGYVAPEVLSDRTYGPACDVWSMGVVLYMLLSGQAPFPLHPDADDAKTLKERLDYELEAINYGRAPKVWYAHFEEEPWTHVSSDAKNLLSKMLKVNPDKRISVDGVLRHPWIKRHQLGTWNEYLNFE